MNDGRDVSEHASTAVHVEFLHTRRGGTSPASDVSRSDADVTKDRSDADRRGRILASGAINDGDGSRPGGDG